MSFVGEIRLKLNEGTHRTSVKTRDSIPMYVTLATWEFCNRTTDFIWEVMWVKLKI